MPILYNSITTRLWYFRITMS